MISYAFELLFDQILVYFFKHTEALGHFLFEFVKLLNFSSLVQFLFHENDLFHELCVVTFVLQNHQVVHIFVPLNLEVLELDIRHEFD